MLVEDAIYWAIWDNKSITAGSLNGASTRFHGKVRWVAASFDESFAGAIYGTIVSTDALIAAPNNDLFYAFAGAVLIDVRRRSQRLARSINR